MKYHYYFMMECYCEKDEISMKCARRDCKNLYYLSGDILKTECPQHNFRICGSQKRVCETCNKEGYFVSSGTGNGKTQIFQVDDGKKFLIDEYVDYS